MIAQGIRHVGLEPYAIKVNEFWLKANLYAYLRGEIPILLGIKLYNIEENPPKRIGYHATAVTGFRLNEENNPNKYKDKLILRSSKIDKIYSHDDQIGPFAKMDFSKPITITADDKKEILPTLTTSWRNVNGNKNFVRAVPYMIAIPLYDKIRIPFNLIYLTTQQLNIFLNYIFIEQPTVDNKFVDQLNIEWDIYLTTNNKYKSTLYQSDADGSYYKDILLTKMPKYIWCSTAYLDGEKQFDLLFDATDVKNGNYFILATPYKKDEFNNICEICRYPETEEIAKKFKVKNLTDWFKIQNFD